MNARWLAEAEGDWPLPALFGIPAAPRTARGCSAGVGWGLTEVGSRLSQSFHAWPGGARCPAACPAVPGKFSSAVGSLGLENAVGPEPSSVGALA